MFRHPDGSMQASLPTPNPYAEAARRKWTKLVEHCHDAKNSLQSTSPDMPEDSSWKHYEEPLSDPCHPFNTFLASQRQPLSNSP
ncbi:hypothetical protein ABBQ38_007063 [Trebouxia sp. C0009 RCD-2024]